MRVGSNRLLPQASKAFIPGVFPPKCGFRFSPEIISKASTATFKLGKLDGITQLLPDGDFFLLMYLRKDAASSSQIEGTKATLIDAIEAESRPSKELPDDVDDILHYIHALKYGLDRLEELPISLRLIKEIHRELMKGARATPFSDPGNFRRSQNWIGGTSLTNAPFIPPPVDEMNRAMSDLEKFLHAKDHILPIIKAGISHAQFETIHPFLDGNGRTGRMLVTLYLHLAGLLELPILFLSSYFKKHQKIYYGKLDGYRDGGMESWLDFFLDGVIEIADEVTDTVRKITKLRERDMMKIQSLNKTASETAVKILLELFKVPIVNVALVQEWTGFTRAGAQKTVDRFVDLEILSLKDKNQKYGRFYVYKEYLDIFRED